VRLSPALDLSFPAGHVELIDLVTALLDDFAPAAIHETGDDDAPEWRVFFGQAATRDDAATALGAVFEPQGVTVTPIDVPDEDWAARSQASLRAVRVGRVIVAPPWDVPHDAGADTVVLVIQPSMGFGTGHHETTRLCLSLLQDIDCRGARVLDVGTGSGVLALASAALGARAVDGIDVDPDAVANADENLALNPSIGHASLIHFSATDLRAGRADVERRHAGPADIVLANLTGALLIAAAPDLLGRAAAGAWLILSGFQHHEGAGVIRAFAEHAVPVRHRSEGEWEAVLLRKAAVCTA
jgi:ribosomal protein L11 methyltransferase